MGRKDKRFHKDIKEQMYDKLTGMLHAGEGTSKKEAISDGTDREKIFSYSTYQSYWKHCKYFANYINENHPECTTLKAARKYVNCHPSDYKLPFPSDCLDLKVGANTVPLIVIGSFPSKMGNPKGARHT